MTENANTVLRDALALSADERAHVAADLIASLENSRDDPKAVAAAWAEELGRRADEVVQHQSVAEPWHVVRSRITERLGNE